jgi:hypothetical protein
MTIVLTILGIAVLLYAMPSLFSALIVGTSYVLKVIGLIGADES